MIRIISKEEYSRLKNMEKEIKSMEKHFDNLATNKDGSYIGKYHNYSSRELALFMRYLLSQ